MRNTILPVVLGFALVTGAIAMFVTTLPRAQEASDESPAEADDAAEKPAKPPQGELTEKGLVFQVPYERGEGELVFARQNGLLRVDFDVRIPYHGGDPNGRDRGSTVSLALSVDGRNGRYLTYYPSPLWLPARDGSLPAFRTEAIYGISDGLRRSGEEAGFGAAAEIGGWDRFRASLFIDMRRVILPGNTPGSPSDEWFAGVAVGSEAGASVFPEQLDPANPAKSAKHMIAFKLSELPELAEADEDPRQAAIEHEKALHEQMRALSARMAAGDMAGAFKVTLEAREKHAGHLWPYHLAYLISNQIRNVEGIDNEYLPYLKAYVDAAPGQSRAHFEYIDALFKEQQEADAFAHFKRLSESPLVTGRKETAAYMNLEWCNRLISHGYADGADAILKQLEEDEALAADDSLRLNLKFTRASLAERRGDSAKAAAIYAEIMTKERKQLSQQQIQAVQQMQQFQLQAVEQWTDELKYREADAEKKNPRWIIETDKGRIVIELFEDDSPNTVASLVSLANKKFYDGFNFHRVIEDFMAQGGCPNGDGTGGPGYRTKFEENKRKHFRGTVAMARSQSKDSQGSQFYICFANSANVLNLSGNYLVVGRVIEGMDVVDKLRIGSKINSIRAENLRDHDYTPEVIED